MSKEVLRMTFVHLMYFEEDCVRGNETEACSLALRLPPHPEGSSGPPDHCASGGNAWLSSTAIAGLWDAWGLSAFGQVRCLKKPRISGCLRASGLGPALLSPHLAG